MIGLRTPPLRERREDLPGLVDALLQRICSESGQPIPTLTADALAWLQARELPGNVRELENLLQRALALSSGSQLQAQDFADPGDVDAGFTATRPPSEPVEAAEVPTPQPDTIPDDLQGYLDEQERQVLLKALKECDYNRTAAANRLGLNLRQIRYRIQRLGITMPSDDDDSTT